MIEKQTGRNSMKNDEIDCADKYNFTATCGPVPDYVTCPDCGLDIEFWTAAEVTRCFFCGRRLFWCESTVH